MKLLSLSRVDLQRQRVDWVSGPYLFDTLVSQIRGGAVSCQGTGGIGFGVGLVYVCNQFFVPPAFSQFNKPRHTQA